MNILGVIIAVALTLFIIVIIAWISVLQDDNRELKMRAERFEELWQSEYLSNVEHQNRMKP